jgi:hypothetical protein
VHPDYSGKKIASHLHDYLVVHWEENLNGTLRLATGSMRQQVQHLCERSGFVKVADLTPYAIDAVQTDGEPLPFVPVAPEEAKEAARFALESETLPLFSGLFNLGWQYAPPRPEYFLENVWEVRGFWWNGREGLAAVYLDEDDETGQVTLTATALACKRDDFGNMLRDLARLAGRESCAEAAIMGPLVNGPLPEIEAAGYRRSWDDSIFIYEKESER